MGKTRKRSKFFKFLSCLNSKTGSIDENMPDEKSSPLSSPIKEIESSSPGKPTWPPPSGAGGGGTTAHVRKPRQQQAEVTSHSVTPAGQSGSAARVRHMLS